MFSAGVSALLLGAVLIVAARHAKRQRALELAGGWLFIAGLGALGLALAAAFHLH